MKTILTLTQQDITPDSPVVDTAGFRKREAARAVVLGQDNTVYLLNVTKHGHHKLPGGGIDEGEGSRQALKRELLEEVGCQAEIIAELGQVIEYHTYEDGGLAQTSFCYVARQVGEQVESSLGEKEIAEGMVQVKVKNLDAAIDLLQQDEPDNTEGKFIQKRDLAILRAAKDVL